MGAPITRTRASGSVVIQAGQTIRQQLSSKALQPLTSVRLTSVQAQSPERVSRAISDFQLAVAQQVSSVRSCPIVGAGGVHFRNVAVVGGSTKLLTHSLGRPYVGYIVTRTKSPAAVGLQSMLFTGPGSFTPTTSSVIVIGYGGGGAGGQGSAGDTTKRSGGGGGGGGSTQIVAVVATTIGTPVTVTIGNGGTSGGNGATSSFGSTVFAGGTGGGAGTSGTGDGSAGGGGGTNGGSTKITGTDVTSSNTVLSYLAAGAAGWGARGGGNFPASLAAIGQTSLQGFAGGARGGTGADNTNLGGSGGGGGGGGPGGTGGAGGAGGAGSAAGTGADGNPGASAAANSGAGGGGGGAGGGGVTPGNAGASGGGGSGKITVFWVGTALVVNDVALPAGVSPSTAINLFASSTGTIDVWVF